MADSNDVLRAMGKLEGLMEGFTKKLDEMQRDFIEEKREAQASRRVLYQRVEAVERSVIDGNRATEALREDVTEKVADLGEELAQFKSEVGPPVADFRRMKQLGLGITGVIAAGGLSVGAMLTWAGEASAAYLRNFLGVE